MTSVSRVAKTAPGPLLLAGAAGLAALALTNHLLARRAERRHPPTGDFLEVDGVRLHYRDRGNGPPLVLIHGNMVDGEDFDVAGLAEALLPGHRVIVFDRPGFGHSARPHGRLWTADRQADLLHAALGQLGVVRPVLVGHSWGAIVALAMATRHPEATAGVVAVSGYYFWTLRPDVALVGLAALPLLGDLLRFTVSPLLGRLGMPLVKRALFSPGKVPARFERRFSTAMALRPKQIRATSQDGALMIPGALALRERYRTLAMPVTIIAGAGDRIVFKRRAERLQRTIPGSELLIVPGAGHMVHHQATEQVRAAVIAVLDRAAPVALPISRAA